MNLDNHMEGSFLIDLKKSLTCPKCNGENFIIKREATYLYTYKINSQNFDETTKRAKTVPFLFDNREKEISREYIECETCGIKYLLSLDELKNEIDFTILQKAIRSDYIENPEFLG